MPVHVIVVPFAFAARLAAQISKRWGRAYVRIDRTSKGDKECSICIEPHQWVDQSTEPGDIVHTEPHRIDPEAIRSFCEGYLCALEDDSWNE